MFKFDEGVMKTLESYGFGKNPEAEKCMKMLNVVADGLSVELDDDTLSLAILYFSIYTGDLVKYYKVDNPRHTDVEIDGAIQRSGHNIVMDAVTDNIHLVGDNVGMELYAKLVLDALMRYKVELWNSFTALFEPSIARIIELILLVESIVEEADTWSNTTS